MILILNILDRNNGTWYLVGGNKIIKDYNFIISQDKNSILFELDKFLKDNKIKLKNINGIILGVKETSLVQIKVIIGIINTIAWNFNIPVISKLYYTKEFIKILPSLIKKISKEKKFKPLKAEYKHKPNITISKKKPVFSITK